MCEIFIVCARTQNRPFCFGRYLFSVFLQSVLLNLQEEMRSHASNLCNLSKAICFVSLFPYFFEVFFSVIAQYKFY